MKLTKSLHNASAMGGMHYGTRCKKAIPRCPPPPLREGA